MDSEEVVLPTLSTKAVFYYENPNFDKCRSQSGKYNNNEHPSLSHSISYLAVSASA
jgi:hypothetical protein